MGSHVPSLPLPPLKAKMTDEGSLIRAVQVDAPGAFREFVERYQSPIYSLLVALLADPASADRVAQEVFIEAHRSISKCKATESPLASLYAITFRLGLREAAQTPPRSGDTRRVRALELLRNLNQYDGLLLVLRELQGYSVTALSSLVRVDESVIRARLLEARQNAVRLIGKGVK